MIGLGCRVVAKCVSRAVVVVLCTACIQSRPSESRPLAPGGQPCTKQGRTLDSAFAVEQARSALAQPGLAFEPGSFQPVRIQGQELGLLISLTVSVPPNTVGGGGSSG